MTGNIGRLRLSAIAVLGLSAIHSAPGMAQATRTWVSGVGDDVNPCSRTAPCKTFAGAISKTAAGGEINCLDPGGFGTLTIVKSITVDCTGTFGSGLNSGGVNGFVVNDSASATPRTANVVLRGLTINGAGVSPGLNGIRFISGRSLVLQDIFIQNQRGANGISIAPSAGTVSLNAEDVTVTNGAGGILLAPTASGAIKAALRNVRVSNNSGNGIEIGTPGLTSVTLTVANSIISNNGGRIIANTGGAGSPARVMIVDSTIASNTNAGLSSSGGGAVVRISNVAITGNATGVNTASGASTNSYGNNHIDGNTADVAGTAIAIIAPE